MDTVNGQGECTYDLSHSWPAEHASWNGGAMDCLLSTHTSSGYEGILGTNTMGYFKRDIPFYYTSPNSSRSATTTSAPCSDPPIRTG